MEKMNVDLKNIIKRREMEVEDEIEGIMEERKRKGEIESKKSIIEEMRNGVMKGGKRMRKFIVIESDEILGK